MQEQHAALDPKSAPAYQSGRQWVSSFNFDAELQKSFRFPDPLTIFDSTVRKALYTPGMTASTDDLLYISEALEEIGVRHVLLNLHWWGESEPERRELETCKAILERNFAFRVTVLPVPGTAATGSQAGSSISIVEAIETVRGLGATAIELPFQVAKSEDQNERVEEMTNAIEYARSLGLSVVLGLPDVARARLEDAVYLANEGLKLNIERISLLDSYSSLSTDGMKLWCTRFAAGLDSPVPLTMHVHNDFGMGTALAIAATTSGVNPDVSVNSLSYRAGFAALEEVATVLEVLYGVSTGIRLDQLVRLSSLVSERTGVAIPPIKAISGGHAFLRDLPPAMIAYLTNGPDVFPTPNSCLAPSVVGSRLEVVWGHHHSDAVIAEKLTQMRLPVTSAALKEIRRAIDEGLEQKAAYPRWLTEAEVEALCTRIIGRQGESAAAT